MNSINVSVFDFAIIVVVVVAKLTKIKFVYIEKKRVFETMRTIKMYKFFFVRLLKSNVFVCAENRKSDGISCCCCCYCTILSAITITIVVVFKRFYSFNIYMWHSNNITNYLCAYWMKPCSFCFFSLLLLFLSAPLFAVSSSI